MADKPFIRIDPDHDTMKALVEAGIPFSRALKYFRDNPEGTASEFFKLAAEDVIPFYGNYRNGGNWKDAVQEAILMFAPMPRNGRSRRQVAVDANGVPNRGDLNFWAKNKLQQFDEVHDAARNKSPLDDINARKNSNERALTQYLDGVAKARKRMDAAVDPAEKERWKANADAMQEMVDWHQKEQAAIEQALNEASIDAIGRTDYKKIMDNMGTGKDPSRFPGGSKYIYDKLVKEYGPELGEQYYNNILNDLTNDITFDTPIYPFIEDLR